MLFHINSLEYAADKIPITPRILRKNIKIRRSFMMERKKIKIFEIIFSCTSENAVHKIYNRIIKRYTAYRLVLKDKLITDTEQEGGAIY